MFQHRLLCGYRILDTVNEFLNYVNAPPRRESGFMRYADNLRFRSLLRSSAGRRFNDQATPQHNSRMDSVQRARRSVKIENVLNTQLSVATSAGTNGSHRYTKIYVYVCAQSWPFIALIMEMDRDIGRGLSELNDSHRFNFR